MPDMTFNCIDCKEDFIFTEGEQDYYRDRGLAIPKRCEKCRLKRRSGLGKNTITPKEEEKK